MMNQASTFQVYNASAGSGKTFSLVKEYLKIVLQNSDPYQFQYILAITFTNKAANEMKERIVKNLSQFADPTILSNPSDMFLKIGEETSIDLKTIHQRSKIVLQKILTNYGLFSVSTIDSFTHKLIRNFAFDLGLPINFDVELKSKNLLDLAVDNLIGQIGKDEELTNFLIDYALQNIEENKSWDFSEVLKNNAQILLNESDRIHFEQTATFDLHQFKELNQQLFKRKKQIENQFKKLGELGLELMLKHDVDNDFNHGDLPNFFRKLLSFNNAHNTLKFEGRLFDNINKGLLYSKSLATHKKENIDRISEELIGIYNQSKNVFETEYPNYVLAQLVSKNISAYAVLNHLNKELQELKKDKKLLLSAEFNRLISNEIKDQPAPFIYEKLGTKFRHYFIDEMQDTSELQWQNLIPLIENALSQENGSLLLVGDAKQSIYRWRGGKTEQFIGLTSDGKALENNPFLIDKKTQFLDTNFRSYKTVVDFNNAFFSHIAQYLENEQHQKLFVDTVKQEVSNNKNGGFVQVSFVKKAAEDQDSNQPFLRKIKAVIETIDLNFNKNEVCILVRQNKQGVAIANYLINEGIQVVSSESLLIANSDKVDFIINLLTYLHQPTHEIVQFKVLSFLHQHFQIVDDYHQFISSLIKSSSIDLFKKLSNFSIDFNSTIFFQKSLYEGVEYLISCFKLAPHSDAYLQYFLDFVLDLQSKDSNNLQGLLSEWEAQKDNLSIIAPENKDAVRIMTIHKAKGLEFPVVIFPFDLEINNFRKEQTWITNLSKQDYNGLPAMKIDLTQQILKTGAEGERLYQERKDEITLDNYNLLYVTFTRAVEQLYIISEDKKDSEEVKNSHHLLKSYLQNSTETICQIDETVFEIGDSKKVIDQNEREKEKSNITTIAQQQFIGTSTNQQINIVTTASKWWGTAVQEAAIYGTKVHQLLAQINTEDDIESAINDATINAYITLDESDLFSTILANIVNHPKLNNYYQQNLTVYKEREILTETGEIIIPDRIVIETDNSATIIDYKTGNELQEHQDQVNKYAFYVQQMGFKIKSKLLVYINETITVKEVV